MHARTAEVLSALDNSRDTLMQAIMRVPHVSYGRLASSRQRSFTQVIYCAMCKFDRISESRS